LQHDKPFLDLYSSRHAILDDEACFFSLVIFNGQLDGLAIAEDGFDVIT
jgi:hypothetical protein